MREKVRLIDIFTREKVGLIDIFMRKKRTPTEADALTS